MHHRLVGKQLLGRADVHDAARVQHDGIARDPLAFERQVGRDRLTGTAR